MTYQEVQDFLFSQLPMYQRQGQSAFKKNLDNIIALCDLLGNPQEKFESVHIAGTNGKGSVSHIMAAGIQANGYKVGLYTSPHYKDYRERIKINGEFISEEEVIQFVEKHKEDFLRIQPSFFEITVALAFDHFAKKKVDIAIIETGLGGRLDSTNIITPILSIITNISLDHQSMLGGNVVQIAKEKAGIIKSSIPVVIGEFQEEVISVFEQKAEQSQSQIFRADQESLLTLDNNHFHYRLKEHDWSIDFDSHMTTPYQVKNITTALYSLFVLSDHLKLDLKKIASGIENISTLTYFIGRWMLIQKEPLVIFDSAHNEAGVLSLAKEIQNLTYDKLHIVWGSAADKDVEKICAILPQNAIYYFSKADIPRGMNAIELRNRANNLGLVGYDYPSVKSAYRNALTTANKNDVVLVAGSIFVIAEVL